MNERFKEIRQHFDLSQEAFGKRLGVTKASISRLEKGINNLTDQMLLSVCREFNVNEEWLQTGKGEMFLQTESSVISELAKEFNATDLEIKLLKAYFAIDKDVRSIFMSRLIKNINSDEEVAEELSIDKEISSYRQELEAQKRGMEKSSATPTTKDA